jgi:hypothetical protein
MSDKAKPKVFSRRGFIKGIGSGVVGGYMIVTERSYPIYCPTRSADFPHMTQ